MPWESFHSQVVLHNTASKLSVVRFPLAYRSVDGDRLFEAVDGLGGRVIFAMEEGAFRDLSLDHRYEPADELDELAAAGAWEEHSAGTVRRLTYI